MRIDATRLAMIKPELLELLKNLEIGDTLKGRVLEALGSSISIRTAGGQLLTAMLPEGTSVPKGAFVELTVSNIADGKIYAEFKAEVKDTDLDAKLSQLLKDINLPVDDKNIEAAKMLIKYKLPLGRETIMNITGLQKSIDNLNQSGEGKIALLLSGLDIKNTPVDVLNKLVLRWSSDLVKPEAVEQQVQPVKAAPLSVDAEVSGNEVEQKVITGVKPSFAINDEAITSSGEGIGKAHANTAKTADTEAGKGIAPDEVNVGRAAKPVSNEAREETKGSKGTELLKIVEKLGIEAGSEVKSFAGQVADILASIEKADMEAVTYLVSKDLEATPKNIGMLIKNIENKDGISQFLDKLQQRISIEDNPKLLEIKESIKKVFLEPRQVEDAGEVAEQLKDIAKLGEKLENYLESSGKKDPEIREALSNLRDSIDFIRNINQHTNYMQVPLMINGDPSTAKLYVFKEGRGRKAIDPDNATILVALDLNNLGHLESMIGIKAKTVNVTFRVEYNGIGALIEKHGHLLKKALEEKGYSMNPVRIINLEQPFSLLSLETVLKEGSSEKMHFDKRI